MVCSLCLVNEAVTRSSKVVCYGSVAIGKVPRCRRKIYSSISLCQQLTVIPGKSSIIYLAVEWSWDVYSLFTFVVSLVHRLLPYFGQMNTIFHTNLIAKDSFIFGVHNKPIGVLSCMHILLLSLVQF